MQGVHRLPLEAFKRFWTLVPYFGIGWKWISKFNMLVVYALVMLPGFLRETYCYFSSPQASARCCMHLSPWTVCSEC